MSSTVDPPGRRRVSECVVKPTVIQVLKNDLDTLYETNDQKDLKLSFIVVRNLSQMMSVGLCN